MASGEMGDGASTTELGSMIVAIGSVTSVDVTLAFGVGICEGLRWALSGVIPASVVTTDSSSELRIAGEVRRAGADSLGGLAVLWDTMAGGCGARAVTTSSISATVPCEAGIPPVGDSPFSGPLTGKATEALSLGDGSGPGKSSSVVRFGVVAVRVSSIVAFRIGEDADVGRAKGPHTTFPSIHSRHRKHPGHFAGAMQGMVVSLCTRPVPLQSPHLAVK